MNMKTLFTLFIALFLFASVDAKIVYLNNNLEKPDISENLYINWADAYAAVSAGDTIYVVGSNFHHGTITINKPIVILGPGYFLNENVQTQINKKSAMFSRIYLVSGSNGTTLKGLSITSGYNQGININDQVSDIVITNTIFNYIAFATASGTVHDNILIHKCYFGGLSHSYNQTGIITNLIVTNNVITGAVSIENGSTGTIAHNLFLHNTLTIGTSSSFNFFNNIYLNKDQNSFTIQPLPDASVHHNISLTGAFGSDNNNFTAPQSTLFNTDENASTDGQYMLSENSPAKGAGSNGTDIGPFGGPDPYRLSGLPNLPNIYELSTGGLVSGDELPVRIKIKQ